MKNNEIMLAQLLQRAAQLWPEKEVLYCGDTVIDYNNLYKKAVSVSFFLQKRDIKKGDKVLLWYENSIEYYTAFFGIIQTGAVVIPVSTFITSAELAHIITDSQASALIVSNLLLPKVPQTTLLIIGEDDLKSPGIDISLLKKFTLQEESPGTVTVIMYTSGTTGRAKGVMLSSHALITNALQGIAALGITSHDRIYVALPLFHSLMQNSGLICPFIIGASCILITKIDRRNILQGLIHKPTFIVGVPSLFGLFCLLKTADFSQVRYFLSGGDMLSEKISTAFEHIYKRNLCNGYGLTETAPFISVNLNNGLQKIGDVGLPFDGIQVQVRDEFNNILETGSIGELWVKGENLMIGYYNAPEATAQVLQDGWLNTGDLGYKDTNNHIILVGRSKDLIISKGIKIYPQEIEVVLLTHPNVTYAAVVSKKQADTEVPICYIASKRKDLDTLEAELKDLCSKKLAPYKIPKKFIIQPELPLTALGKVAKKDLYEL
jgi:long-chain acyl-CoA synthetase